MRPSWKFRPFVLADAPCLSLWLKQTALPGNSALSDDLGWAKRLLADPRIQVEVLVDEARDGDAPEPGASSRHGEEEDEAGTGGRPLGFLRLDLAPDRSAEITLLVDPDRRRQGIGRTLCDHALAAGRRLGLQRLVAVVAETNTAARELFTGAGYDWIGSVPGHHRFDRLIHASGTADPLMIDP